MEIIVFYRCSIFSNGSGRGLSSNQEWSPSQTCLSAIARLSQAGIPVVLVLDQPQVGCGYKDLENLNRSHKKAFSQLKKMGGHLSALFFCPHSDSESCQCSDKHTGLLSQVSERYHVEPSQITVVADELHAIQDAINLKYQTVLIDSNFTKAENKSKSIPTSTPVFCSLPQFTDYQLLS